MKYPTRVDARSNAIGFTCFAPANVAAKTACAVSGSSLPPVALSIWKTGPASVKDTRTPLPSKPYRMLSSHCPLFSTKSAGDRSNARIAFSVAGWDVAGIRDACAHPAPKAAGANMAAATSATRTPIRFLRIIIHPFRAFAPRSVVPDVGARTPHVRLPIPAGIVSGPRGL